MVYTQNKLKIFHVILVKTDRCIEPQYHDLGMFDNRYGATL